LKNKFADDGVQVHYINGLGNKCLKTIGVKKLFRSMDGIGCNEIFPVEGLYCYVVLSQKITA